MNCLSISLNKAAKDGAFHYHSKCQRSELTHLCFADDLLIFCEGSVQSVQAVLAILKDFEDRSGLAVNIAKTSLFAAGIKPHELDQIKQATWLTEGTLPVRYLEVPLCTKKLSITNCAPLLQAIKSKLHSWTTRTLSFAGRLQLLASVIAGITNFWSCAFILPKACLAEIDSLCSRFLWKGKTEGHNSAKVSWASVTTPKKEGGLGLKNLLVWNRAAALKLIWILFFKQDSIWSNWFIREILQGDINNFWVINTRQKHSWQANQLLLLREHAYSWIRRTIGNGETTYFWSCNLSPFGRITDYLGDEPSSQVGIATTATIAELWDIDHWVLPPARSDNQLQCTSSGLKETIGSIVVPTAPLIPSPLKSIELSEEGLLASAMNRPDYPPRCYSFGSPPTCDHYLSSRPIDQALLCFLQVSSFSSMTPYNGLLCVLSGYGFSIYFGFFLVMAT
ncbi:uncharacterized protein LOC130508575 [Raphanus sativus]|uniref:Uncharacterized protein LOC130508575 n=1 Tax=Raphanus sativus TaxID=3726 RepID=A0A9W3D8D4_RAPSA|nr:uncharacterized protein LOC130508575 [Raphanus sativus]